MNVNPEDLLSALRRARGKGLSLKQLAGETGNGNHQALRKSLSQLLKEGRASYDGHVYREVNKRLAPAALVEGARARREKGDEAKREAGSKVTGVIHLKSEGYGFVSPL